MKPGLRAYMVFTFTNAVALLYTVHKFYEAIKGGNRKIKGPTFSELYWE